MREAIATRREDIVLEGEIHIDGKYAGGKIKPKNRKEDREDRRKKNYQNMKRLTILAMREKTPFGRGRERTVKLSDPGAVKRTSIFVDRRLMSSADIEFGKMD